MKTATTTGKAKTIEKIKVLTPLIVSEMEILEDMDIERHEVDWTFNVDEDLYDYKVIVYGELLLNSLEMVLATRN